MENEKGETHKISWLNAMKKFLFSTCLDFQKKKWKSVIALCVFIREKIFPSETDGGKIPP